ncbi:MAG: hypothetical protein AB4372_33515 [Xenococcus sp. (in: cyanobacteria)]
MIISDLNYIESLDLQSAGEVDGGDGYYIPGFPGGSFASAVAAATAVGNNAIAITATSATAVPGGASASSASLAISG